jgi:hypothetical protein
MNIAIDLKTLMPDDPESMLPSAFAESRAGRGALHQAVMRRIKWRFDVQQTHCPFRRRSTAVFMVCKIAGTFIAASNLSSTMRLPLIPMR